MGVNIGVSERFGSWHNAIIEASHNMKFFDQNDNVIWEDCNGIVKARDLFELTSPLASIVSKKGKMFTAGKVEVLNRRTQKYVRGEYKQWERLIENPNPLQSRKKFLKHIYSYLQIYEWCFCFKTYPAGFNDIPSAIYVLPNDFLEIKDIRKPLHKVTREDLLNNVYFTFDGKQEKLDPKNLMLFTGDNFSIDHKTWLPYSRIRSLKYPVSNFHKGLEARNVLIQKKGGIGILANKSSDATGHISMSKEEKDAVQQDLSGYGLSNRLNQVIVTDASLEWQQMAFNTKDLQLFEEHVQDVEDMCDRIDFPPELLSVGENNTYQNKNEAKKSCYQDTIIPEAEDIFEQLNEQLNTPEYNVEYRMYYGDLPILQENAEEAAKARKTQNEALQIEFNNNILTPNQWLEELGRDKVTGELQAIFDKYKFQMNAEERGIIETEMKGNEKPQQ